MENHFSFPIDKEVGRDVPSAVKKIRKGCLLTQNELAQKLGVCRQMVWAYEKGESVPRFNVVRKLLTMAKENNIEINAEDFFIGE